MFDGDPFMNDVITLLWLAEWFVGNESSEFSYFLENWISLITKLLFDLVQPLFMDIPRKRKFERKNSEREISNTGLGLLLIATLP